MNKPIHNDQRETYLLAYRAGWNDALFTMQKTLLGGVAEHHWLAENILKAQKILEKHYEL